MKKEKENQIKKSNIILIILDSARAQDFSCYGSKLKTSPNIDKIAKESLFFENAYSPASWTGPAHASLFQSKLVSNQNVWGSRDFISVLNEKGYNSICITKNEVLHGSKITDNFKFNYQYFYHKLGLAKLLREIIKKVIVPDKYNYNMKSLILKSLINFKFREFLFYFRIMARKGISMFMYKPLKSLLDNLHMDFSSELQIAKKFINRGINPFLMSITCMDTHYEYKCEEENFNNLYFNNFKSVYHNNKNKMKWMVNDFYKGCLKPKHIKINIKNAKKIYRASINYADSLIGGLYSDLENKGLLENSIVIITSDHGEEFLEHNHIGHANCLYNTLIKIPLIIRFPKKMKLVGKYKDYISLIDIFPTLLGVLNLKTDFNFHGKNIFLEKNNAIISEHSEFPEVNQSKKKAIISKGFKYIYNLQGAEELYYLKDDAFEKKNIFSQEKAVVDDLKKKLGNNLKLKSKKIDVSSNLRKAMESMGYI